MWHVFLLQTVSNFLIVLFGMMSKEKIKVFEASIFHGTWCKWSPLCSFLISVFPGNSLFIRLISLICHSCPLWFCSLHQITCIQLFSIAERIHMAATFPIRLFPCSANTISSKIKKKRERIIASLVCIPVIGNSNLVKAYPSGPYRP